MGCILAPKIQGNVVVKTSKKMVYFDVHLFQSSRIHLCIWNAQCLLSLAVVRVVKAMHANFTLCPLSLTVLRIVKAMHANFTSSFICSGGTFFLRASHILSLSDMD